MRITVYDADECVFWVCGWFGYDEWVLNKMMGCICYNLWWYNKDGCGGVGLKAAMKVVFVL